MHVNILKMKDSAMNLRQIKERALEMGLSKKEISQLRKVQLVHYIQKNTQGIVCFGTNLLCQDFHCIWFKACKKEAYENYVITKQ